MRGRHTRNLLRRRLRKVIDLSLIRGTTTMPEEHPLQCLITFKFVLESERVVLVEDLDQIQHLGGSLDDGEGRGLRVIDERRNAAVGIKSQEPFFLLLVGRDVDYCRGPFGVVFLREFFEHNLRGLSIGGVLRDKVQAFGVLDVRGRLGNV